MGVLLLSGLASVAAAAPAPAGRSGPAGAPLPLGTSTNVSVGKMPTGVTPDLANGQIYVPNYGSATVSVISGTSVLKTIHVGTHPQSVTYDPKSTLLYVANVGSLNVSVINGTTHTVVGTISGFTSFSGATVYNAANGAVYLLSSPTTLTSTLWRLPSKSPWTPTSITLGKDVIYVIYDPGDMSLVAANTGSNTLSIVNSTTNSVKTVTLTTGTAPGFSVYNPSNKDLYVVDAGPVFPPIKTGNVTVLGSSNSIVATVKVGSHPVSATLDPNNHDVYVVNATYGVKPRVTNSSVTPITSSNAAKPAIKVGQGAYYATYDPINFDLYVPEAYSNVTVVIQGSTNTVLTTVTTKGNPVIGFFDPATNDVLLLLSNPPTVNGKLLLLSSPTSGNPAVVGSQVLGKDPSGIAYDTKNSKMYVSNQNSNNVTIF